MVDIGQWDSVCTISVDYVNQQLASNLSTVIQTFSYMGSDPLAGDYTISGNFGAWQVVPGGSDQLIDMAIPITSGSLTWSNGSVDISGMVVTVQVSLQLLPATASSGTMLTFDFSSVGTNSGDPVPGLVVPISCTDPNDTGQTSLVQSAVAQCLVQNASSVTFVFASIGVTSDSTSSWLTPAASAYQYQQASDSSSGYFGILSVVTAQDTSGFSTQIDPSLTDAQYAMAFAISQQLFLANVVQPVLPNAFPGTFWDTFSYDASSGAVVNTVSFFAPSVTVGALSYVPTINTVAVTVESSILQVSLSGICDLRLPDASLSFSVTANNTLGFSGGNLTFIPDPSPTTSYTKDIPWYDYLLIGLAGPIADAIFAGVIAAITNDLGQALTASQVGASLTQAPPTSVLWPGMTAWTVQNAGLSTALYLQGQPASS